MAQLLIRESGRRDEAIRELELAASEITVGRSPDCGLPLDNQTVSRRHASIASTEQGWVLTDLGSINGTWVNGEKVSRHLLRHRDSICFGSAVAVFDDPPDPDATVRIDVEALLEMAHRTAAIRIGEHGLQEDQPDGASTEQTWPETAPDDAADAARLSGAAVEAASDRPPSPDGSRQARARSGVGEHELERGLSAPRTARPAPGARHTTDDAQRSRRLYGGFWIRVLAWAVDAVILGMVGFLLTFALGLLAGAAAERAPAMQMYLVPLATAIGFLLPVAYVLVGWSRWGRTPGKSLCGLRVLRDQGGRLGTGGAFVRLLGYVLSSLFLGIGFLMVAFTDRKRGLHDMVAGTVVVRER